MIRGTKNEGFSSLSKQRQTGGALITTGVQGESYETVSSNTGVISEVRDAFNAHISTLTEFPSNAFNGTFE